MGVFSSTCGLFSDQQPISITQNELADLFGITPQAAATYIKQHKIDKFKMANKTNLTPLAVRSFMEKRKICYPQEIIALQMLKVGSGKTTCAFQLGVRLHQYGARVLWIDLDPQADLTRLCQKQGEENSVFFHLLTREKKVSEAIVSIFPGLDIISSDFENAELDMWLLQHEGSQKKLIGDLFKILKRNYDFIIIDCDSRLGVTNKKMSQVADRLLFPVNPDPSSFQAIKKMLSHYSREGVRSEHKLQMLLTKFDIRDSVSQEFLIKFGTEFGAKLLRNSIHFDQKLQCSTKKLNWLFESKRSQAREDFDQLAREILGISTSSEGNKRGNK